MAGAAMMSDQQIQQMGDQTIAQPDNENQLVATNSPYAERLQNLTQGWEVVEGHTPIFNVSIRSPKLMRLQCPMVPSGYTVG